MTDPDERRGGRIALVTGLFMSAHNMSLIASLGTERDDWVIGLWVLGPIALGFFVGAIIGAYNLGREKGR